MSYKIGSINIFQIILLNTSLIIDMSFINTMKCLQIRTKPFSKLHKHVPKKTLVLNWSHFLRRHLGYVNQGKPATDLKILDKNTIPYIFSQILKFPYFQLELHGKMP